MATARVFARSPEALLSRPARDRSFDRNAALFRALRNAGDGAFVIDETGRIQLWNAAAERLLGHTAAETVGRFCCEVLAGRQPSGEPLCGRQCQVRQTVALGTPVESFEVQARTKAGRPARINVSTLVLEGEPGEPPLTVHLFRVVARPAEPPARAAEPALEERLAAARQAGTLTRREREILRLLIAGSNTRVAAERLGVSPSTVRNHVQNLFGKLGVHSRLEAVAFATTHRIV